MRAHELMHDVHAEPEALFPRARLTLGAERVQEREAEIVCTFTPISGAPIRARPTAPLMVGPLGKD